jgi:hypothetical protein
MKKQARSINVEIRVGSQTNNPGSVGATILIAQA